MKDLPNIVGLPTSLALQGPGDQPENPRERLLNRGVAALTDVELVALCLRTGAAGVSVLGLARQLIEHFGGIAGLFAAPASRLLALPGLGPAKVSTLVAASALAERSAAAKLPPDQPLHSAAAALNYVQQTIGRSQREIFGCLFLDARHRPLGFERLFLGSVDRAHVHPREVLKQALTYNAASVILAHNHPSGVCEPSASDIRLTEQLQYLLLQIDVRVIDHLIVTAAGGQSMAQLGLLKPDSA
ncbi:MAG: RadC family protein [Pseudomonadales bacterium]